MNRRLTFIFIFIFFSSRLFANGLEKIIVERYYVSDAKDASALGGHLNAGSVTYRIYVDMLPGYKFQAAYGIPGHELRIKTSTLFFNNEEYGGVIPNVIPDRNLKHYTVMLDSWLSAGAASESNLGILKSSDNGVTTIVNGKGFLQNADPSCGIPIKIRDGLIPGEIPKVMSFGIDSMITVFDRRTSGSLFSTSNGSWACFNGSKGPTDDNMVLIAQITTDGVFSFELNIQVATPEGGVENYVARNPVDKEIQLESLIYNSESVRVKEEAR